MTDFVQRAIALGAVEAKMIRATDVVVGDWVPWKCRYGCPVYNRSWTCPPHSPTPDETRRFVAAFSEVLAVRVTAKGDSEARSAWRVLNEMVIQLEREIFLAGHRKAFGLGGGRCAWCDECDTNAPCQHPHQARPSMEACGIDIEATVTAAGWQYRVVADKESDVQWFGLVFVD